MTLEEYNRVLRELHGDDLRNKLRSIRVHHNRAMIGDVVFFPASNTYELVTGIKTVETYDGKNFESLTQLVTTTCREYTRVLTIPKNQN